MGMTLPEVKTRGWAALVRELGYSGATKFILSHEPGTGDYTTERRELFRDLTIEEIVQEIKTEKERT